MPWYAIIAAAWFTTLVVRKLPGVRDLVAEGKKPWACDACCASWTTLFWNAGALTECGAFGVSEWHAWLGGTAALAGGVFVLLFGWSLLLRTVGWVDDPKPSDFSPPGGA